MFPLRLLRTARRVLPAKSLSTTGQLTDLTVDNEGIATLTLQRAPVNSLNVELLQELTTVLGQVEKDKAKGLVLTSASPSVFSAGLDITEMYNPNVERLTALWTSLQDLWATLYSAPYPTAVAINGHAPAGGCMMALCCEYRTMVSGRYTIGLNETAVGIPVPEWLIGTMCKVISQREAEVALNAGLMFTVEEALKVGLIDETATDKADAIEKSKKFIKRFDKISPIAHSLTKQRFRSDVLQPFAKNREADLNQFKYVVLQPEVQELLGQIIQKLKQKKAAK
ncbi:hypothetical protein ABMA27_015143 [Loxostege sticticalis]|uniref:Uncharacterized protein n=1 Tax=Loxostege sticticalis TaxID=481309 RepID=A0ABR3I6J1_LOXSC